MTDEIAISVKKVSKAYRVWNSPEARLRSAFFRSIGMYERAKSSYRDFLALSEIDFAIPRGQSVGILGLNGSGKSTLLQIIAGTLRPTSGEVDVKGRIAALLELGAGFNPEFSGRENVYMNATVLGLSRNEIDSRFADIAAFADIGDFIEQPVKTYSSGMFVRLAFAVLSQIEPEILIVDEALAVGDFLFQQKCYDRIKAFRREGRTFLFVSHGMATVLELCERAIVLDHGRILFDGPPAQAVARYEENAIRHRYSQQALAPSPAAGFRGDVRHGGTAAARLKEYSLQSNIDQQSVTARPGSIHSSAVELVFARFHNVSQEETTLFRTGEEMIISIGVRVSRALAEPHVGFKIRDRMARVIFETSSLCMYHMPEALHAGETLIGNFRFKVPLSEGDYSLVVGFAEGSVGTSDYREALLFLPDIKSFTVVKASSDIIWSGITHLYPTLGWSIIPAPSSS